MRHIILPITIVGSNTITMFELEQFNFVFEVLFNALNSGRYHSPLSCIKTQITISLLIHSVFFARELVQKSRQT